MKPILAGKHWELSRILSPSFRLIVWPRLDDIAPFYFQLAIGRLVFTYCRRLA